MNNVVHRTDFVLLKNTPTKVIIMLTVSETPQPGQSALCEPILRALPRWFGREASTQQYLRDIEVQPTFVAAIDMLPVGFLTLTEHSPYAAEIHVMAVLPTHHRQGVGRALLSAAEAYLQTRGVALLQVKTLGPRHPSIDYALTRAFYLGVGFRLLEEFPDLWGADLPCWQLVKVI
jgi:GNAT superfamily N-acetyltransferase